METGQVAPGLGDQRSEVELSLLQNLILLNAIYFREDFSGGTIEGILLLTIITI